MAKLGIKAAVARSRASIGTDGDTFGTRVLRELLRMRREDGGERLDEAMSLRVRSRAA